MSQRAVLGTVILIALLIGGNFTALKFALDHSTPLLITSLRTVIGGTALLAFALVRGERLPNRAIDFANIFVVSFTITTTSSALLVIGINRVPAGVASLISSTFPLFTAMLSFLMLGAAVSRLGLVGLAVGFTGTIVLASPSLGGDAATVGIAALAFAAFSWAFGSVYMKWKDFSRVSPVMLVGVQLYMSSLVLFPTALIFEDPGQTDWSLGLLAPLLYAAIPANAVTFALLATVVRRATPTQAAASAYLIPVFGVFFGWLLRDERLGTAEVVGGALVVVGVYVLVTATARQAIAASTAVARSPA